MSLIYFITSLPPLAQGTPPPMSRHDFMARARDSIAPQRRRELELALLLEETEESIRIITEARLEQPQPSTSEITHRLVNDRRQTPLGPTAAELPAWLLRLSPPHVLMRSWHRHVLDETSSDFLRQYTVFSLRHREVIVGLLARQMELSESRFLAQLEGGFGSTFTVLRNNFDSADLGVGDRFWWYETVAGAVGNDDMATMERELDMLRWRKIEAFRGTTLFSMDTILAYYFQLRILERHASWNETVGQAKLDELLHIDLDGTQ